MQEKQETQVQSLDQEDALEEEVAIHSSILAQEIPSGAWQTTVHWLQIAEHDLVTEHTHTHTFKPVRKFS